MKREKKNSVLAFIDPKSPLWLDQERVPLLRRSQPEFKLRVSERNGGELFEDSVVAVMPCIDHDGVSSILSKILLGAPDPMRHLEVIDSIRLQAGLPSKLGSYVLVERSVMVPELGTQSIELVSTEFDFHNGEFRSHYVREPTILGLTGTDWRMKAHFNAYIGQATDAVAAIDVVRHLVHHKYQIASTPMEFRRKVFEASEGSADSIMGVESIYRDAITAWGSVMSVQSIIAILIHIYGELS